MGTMTDQNEKAFQKQQPIFLGSRRILSKKGARGKRDRYYKNVGLGFKIPKEAIEGTYVDKNCPFTGNVSIRGRILKGVVKTHKMQRTIIVRRDYLHYIKKYNRFEKRHRNVPAHLSPCFRVSEGDPVVIGQCRPISKTVRYNVLAVERVGAGKGVKIFQK